MSDQGLVNFAANLRQLCANKGTVTSVCRELGINRQQFNKYLAGHHLPSRRNLALISRHFGIGEKDLFREPKQFSRIYDFTETSRIQSLAGLPRLARFLESAMQGNETCRQFIGRYHRYHFSSIYRGKILRSLLSIYESDGVIAYNYIERFPTLDREGKTSHIFKYHGMCLMIDDRLFLIDSETILKNEMTFGILVPVVRSNRRFLFGVTMGVAATPFREPFATRVVLDFRGQGLATKRHLKEAITLSPDDQSVPFEVLSYLQADQNIEALIVRGR